MHTILLLRHAHAVLPGRDGKDFDRILSQSGEAEAIWQAQHMLQAGLQPDFILSSPAARAMQTAEIFQAALNNIADALPDIYECPSLYRADAAGYLEKIHKEIPETARCALLVGHNPGIENFIFLFARGHKNYEEQMSYGFPTAGLAVLETMHNYSIFSSQTAQLTALYFPLPV